MTGAASELAFMAATALRDAYRRRALSPVEVTRAVLAQADAWEPTLNAFCVLDPDAALRDAAASEARWAKGQPAGPVDGVPVSIKDMFLTKGWPTRKGSRLTPGEGPWTEDSPPAERLRQSGAVILGKTTTPEFGWKALGDSPLTGITRNPWDPERTPGGSSAGAAAALAAGIGALAVGSDGGGSIRIPSSFCGLAGIKPSFGRVPYYPPAGMSLLSHCGPMARTVDDAALMLQVLSGRDPRDPFSLPIPPFDPAEMSGQGVRGLRIAASATLGYAKLHPEVAAAFQTAVSRLRTLGAEVDEVEEVFPSPGRTFEVLWKSGAAHIVAQFPAERHGEFDPGLVESARRGREFTATDYVKADLFRTELGGRMAAFHERYDLLVTPTVAVPALPVGVDLNDPDQEEDWIDWVPFCYPFNMTRQPAVSVHAGLSSDGLPIGLQIVGPLYADALVLRAAKAFEADRGVIRWPTLNPSRAAGAPGRA